MRDENKNRITSATKNERLRVELSDHNIDPVRRIIGTSILNIIKPRPIAMTVHRIFFFTFVGKNQLGTVFHKEVDHFCLLY